MRYLVELVLARTPEKDEEWENGGRLELVELGEKFDLDTHAVKLLHQLAADRNFELRVGELSEW
ncbi:hypothetical protein FRC02_009605 [Tulasnella sp. 418]|nr:hypothetical protein FRC02_009605 [Tulasnella sp. 418]